MSTKIFQGDVSSKMGHFMFDSYMDMTEQFLCFNLPYSVIFEALLAMAIFTVKIEFLIYRVSEGKIFDFKWPP